MSEEKLLFRVNECKEKTGLSVAYWRRAILERRVSVVRIGRSVLIPKSEIERLIKDGFQPRLEANLGTGR